MWGSCLSTVRAIGCGCWFTNAAIYTLCFQHDSSLSGDMRPEKMAPYIGAAVLRQLPHYCPLTDVLRLHRFNTPSSVYLQIDLYDGKCLAWALSGFGEMEDAADLMRGGVGLDVVGGDDCLHPFRHRLVFPVCQRRKV